MDKIEIDNLPDHVEIDMKYYPDGVGPGGFSPSVLKAHADARQLGSWHEMEGMKSWIIIWLLDHIDWDKIDNKTNYISLEPLKEDSHEPAGPMRWRDGE